MSKVLVTGGAGFVGSVLCRNLLNSGHEVVCLDSLEKGDGDSLLDVVTNPNFTFVKGDVRDTTKLDNLIPSVDGVIHLAGYVGAPICESKKDESRSVNVNGTKAVVDRLSPSQRFVNASSGSVYGALEEICTESCCLNPKSNYGIQKKIAEDMAHTRDNSISFRFATGFGVSPNMRVNLLPNSLVYEAVYNRSFSVFQPEAKRTFIPVQEMARALQWALFDTTKCGVFNCGHENFNMTKRGLAELIKSRTGCEVFYGEYLTDIDQRDYAVSYEKLREAGFVVQGDMQTEIDNLVKASQLIRNTNLRYN